LHRYRQWRYGEEREKALKWALQCRNHLAESYSYLVPKPATLKRPLSGFGLAESHLEINPLNTLSSTL
jgi:hypothetical protein